MYRIYKYIIALLIASPSLVGQVIEPDMKLDVPEENPSKQGKFYIIPEVSFWFGPYTTLDVSPLVGFHLTDRFSVGPGFHYNYYRNIDYFSPERWSTHIYGVKLFSRLDLLRNAGEFLPIYLFDDLFVHAEYEALSLESRYFSAPGSNNGERFWMSNYFIGFGIMQRMRELNGYSIMLLWNLNNSYYTPYSNPTYRVGLTLYL